MKLMAERKHKMKLSEKEWMVSQGMSKEMVREFEKTFEADIKRLQRNKEEIKEKGYSFIILDAASDEDDGSSIFPEIEDVTENENIWLQQMHIDMLRSFLSEMSEEDRRILYVSFSGVYNFDEVLAEEYGVTKRAIRYRRDVLIKQLRKKFNVK